MELFGVTHDNIARGRVTPGFVGLMKFQIERASALYRSADAGIPQLTNDGSRFCVVLMSRTYAGILRAIAANGFDTLTRRAYVPLSRKFRIAIGAYLGKSPRQGCRPASSRQGAIPMVHGLQPRESSHVL
jgi:phytoene/squalene synthetase